MAMKLTSKQARNQISRMFAAAKKDDSLELLIYDSIGQDWWGGLTAESVKQKLDEAGDVKKISVRINSPGGDVFEGAAIYSLLSQHKAQVECYIDGLAASAAFTIAMAADTIHISEAAMMMCHNAWGLCMGYASDMEKMAGTLNKVSGTMRDIYATKSGMKADEVQTLMDQETWMTAQEAVDQGFADDVIKRTADDQEEQSAKALIAAFLDLDASELPNNGQRELWNRIAAKLRTTPVRAGATGNEDWPLSERDHAWGASAADDRIRKWASSDGSGDKDKMDWAKYRSVHFWYDENNDKSFGGYKLLFCDVLSSQVTAVWRGVTACAAVMQGGRGGVDIPEGDRDGVKAKIAGYYKKAAKKYDDDSITVPWEASAKADDGTGYDADGECMCGCPQCEGGDCANCTNEDCTDPNCEGCPNQQGEGMDDKAKADLAELELMREEIEFLTI